MYHKFITPSIVIIAVLVAVLLYNGPKKEYKKTQGAIQGTTYNITYEYPLRKDLSKEIEELLNDFDLSLSTYIPQSVISRINRNDPDVQIDDRFLKVFQVAKEVYEKSGGLFDITVAPIVNAWGFGFTPGAEVDSAMIDSLLQFVGMNKVHLEGRKVIKDDPRIMFDANAIAQGYSVDVVAEFLDKKHVENYLVEIGGELKCKGKNAKGEDWKIGIDRPEEGNFQAGTNLQAVIAIKTKALATSGNYRKFYEKNGIKYAHTINPKTGYPVISRLLSATVLADECITADAFATTFMVMGLEESISFLENQDELEAYLIYSDEEGNFKVYTTPGIKSHLIEERK
jgi:thiamine biosynthesis lipoprotein